MHHTPKFSLDQPFILQYATKKPKFGFGALGEIVYKRTYSRIKDSGKSEEWWETVERVVNGSFNMQREHLAKEGINFDYAQAQIDGQKMYDKIYNFKFLPPGRGLWAMGTRITEEKKIFAALNNCAFVSTDTDAPEQFSKPFIFLMDASMLGVGCGFDTKGAGKITIKKPLSPSETYVIEDSREGWVNSVKLLLDSYFIGKNEIVLDYSKIRPEGILLKGFGGISSGPEPLKNLHISINNVLSKCEDKIITTRIIVDLMNMIGKCIVSGNIRRTAEIAFGEPEDEEFLHLKNYEKNPERKDYGWTSNNSVFAKIGMDYTKAAANIRKNGEPGFAWLDNMKKYGRMCDPPDNKDMKARGGNPCLEQTLESYEMCCLVETFPYNHSTYSEFEETLRLAFMYAKTVTLGETHWEETNEVIKRNRRIGCSMSGIAQFISQYDLDTLRDWCDKGYKFLRRYDEMLSNNFKVNQSIKLTSIKPSGTVSLLAGATPGVHFPQSKFYIRRIRVDVNNELMNPLKDAGYHIEPDVYNNDNKTMVVEIPVSLGKNIRTIKDVSMWEQLSIASFMQKYWSDNQVSCTITFNPETEGAQIPHALNYFQYQLKGISFLPNLDSKKSTYPQMPYEEISEMKYEEICKQISVINIRGKSKGEVIDPSASLFCDGDTCQIIGS